jgi:hypothetical protein
VVRRYASTDTPSITEADLKKLVIPPFWVRMPRILPADTGMHRWVWDLHNAPPESLRHEYPISAIPHDTPRLPRGARALPGLYTVKLTASGKSYTAPLRVNMDPRVKATPEELRQQFDMGTELTSLITRSTEAIWEARSVAGQVGKLIPQATGTVAEKLKALDKEIQLLLTASEEFPAPGPIQISLKRVNDRVSALYSAIDSADAAPTLAQGAAMAQIRREFSGATTRWSEVKTTNVAALNGVLGSAKFPEIRLELKPSHEEDADDSDLE